MLTAISLLITWQCPHCRHHATDDFLTVGEVVCHNCKRRREWADVLTEQEHNALDAAEEFLTPINPESIWTIFDDDERPLDEDQQPCRLHEWIIDENGNKRGNVERCNVCGTFRP